MDAFSYLSVLLSIILGLAITQVLQGVRALLLARSRVRLFAPPMIWAGVMLVVATQNWWSSFGLSDHQEWTFAAFGAVLLQTVLLYMAAALALPDVPADVPIDLREHYWREARPFFEFFLAMLAVSVGKDMVLDGRPPSPGNLAFHGLFAISCLFGLFSRRPAVHQTVAAISAVLLAIYIALLFARLG